MRHGAGDSSTFGANHINGKEHDQLTSLSYYGYRFYDRLTLSWTQADPLYRFVPDLAWDEPRRANLYSFSLNNPLRYYDPDGRDSCNGKPDCKWIENGGTGQDRARGSQKKKKSAAGTEGEGSEGEVGDEAGGGSDDGVTGKRKLGRHNGGKKGGVESGTPDGATEEPLFDFGEFGLINGYMPVTPETKSAWEGLKVLLAYATAVVGAVVAGGAAAGESVQFGQSSVSNVFAHGPFKGRTIGEVAGGLRSGTISPDDLPLDVVVRGGRSITINNRSLAALRRAGVKPTVVRDRTGDAHFEKLIDSHLRGGSPSDVIRVRGGPTNASWLE
jgi:RHS repeat-associated protein